MRAYTYKSEEQRQELKADIERAEQELATVPDISPERAAALAELIDTDNRLFFDMA